MRKLITGLAVVALSFGLLGSALAATDDTIVTVTVSSFDLLTVPATESITVTATLNEPNYPEGSATAAGGFEFSHNHTTNMTVSAVAAKDITNAANDMTVTVQVGAAAAVTLVSGGVDGAGGAVYSAKAAGDYNEDISYTVNGSLASTKTDSYLWTVTFTSADI